MDALEGTELDGRDLATRRAVVGELVLRRVEVEVHHEDPRWIHDVATVLSSLRGLKSGFGSPLAFSGPALKNSSVQGWWLLLAVD